MKPNQHSQKSDRPDDEPQWGWFSRWRRGFAQLWRRAATAVQRAKRGHDERMRTSTEYRAAIRTVVVASQAVVAIAVGGEVAALVVAVGLAYVCFHAVDLSGSAGVVA